MLFYCHPRCTTCAKARRWLDERGIAYEWRDIRQQTPTQEELRRWHKQSGLALKKFFNTSGQAYRAQQLSRRLPAMPEDEQLALLAADGMLIKRPLLVFEGGVLVGFGPGAWEKALANGDKWCVQKWKTGFVEIFRWIYFFFRV